MKKILFIALLIVVLFNGVSFGGGAIYTITKGSLVCVELDDLLFFCELANRYDSDGVGRRALIKQNRCVYVEKQEVLVYKTGRTKDLFTQFLVISTSVTGWTLDPRLVRR